MYILYNNAMITVCIQVLFDSDWQQISVTDPWHIGQPSPHIFKKNLVKTGKQLFLGTVVARNYSFLLKKYNIKYRWPFISFFIIYKELDLIGKSERNDPTAVSITDRPERSVTPYFW